jgi:hypothetical protein
MLVFSCQFLFSNDYSMKQQKKHSGRMYHTRLTAKKIQNLLCASAPDAGTRYWGFFSSSNYDIILSGMH